MPIFKKMVTEKAHDVESTKEKILSLLNHATNYVYMSSGLNSGFYNDEDIRNAIIGAANRVNSFKLLIDGDINESKKEISWLSDLMDRKKIQVRQKKGIFHWTIIDGNSCRLEKFHPAGAVGTKNLMVWELDSAISSIIQDTFNEWWDSDDEPSE